MKFIPCIVETFHTEAEDYWEISVPCEHASDAALEFSAMHLGLADRIVFSDGQTSFTIRPDSVTLSQRTVSVDKIWLECIWRLFLNTHRTGWTNTAHIDQDFRDKTCELCITISVAPPA